MEMNLFLCPSIISDVGSVVDVVAREILVRLTGGVEFESLCHQYKAEVTAKRSYSNKQNQKATVGDDSTDGSDEEKTVILSKLLDQVEESWSECWVLMEVARSHLAGYPVAVNALILLRSIHSALRVLASVTSTTASDFYQRIRRSTSFWLAQTTFFFADFLAPCMLILPPVPLLSGLAHEVLELLDRCDQRKVIEALPSIAATLSLQSGKLHQLSYPAERIATVRHNSLLSYCVSRLTEKNVATFSSVLAPVLHAAPKMVLDKLLQRAIAYPAVELQAVNAQLLKTAPPLVFILLPVMASERVAVAIARDESTAEARAAAVATLVALVWRQSWDAFAFGHVFDSIELSLKEPTRTTLLFVIPFLKSIFSLLALKFCESEKTYNSQQLESLHGGPLLRWWTCGDSENLLSRWTAQTSFTPNFLQNSLWVQFQNVLVHQQQQQQQKGSSTSSSSSSSSLPSPLGARLLWSLFQLLAATNGIYEDSPGTAEANTLKSLSDQDVIQDLCRILIDGLRGAFDPRLYTTTSSNAKHDVLSLKSLSKVTPRCFALLNSDERVSVRKSILTSTYQSLIDDNDEEQMQQQTSKLLSILLCATNCNRSHDDSDVPSSENEIVDPLFGIDLVLIEQQQQAVERQDHSRSQGSCYYLLPKNKSIIPELEFYALFWLLDLADLEPLSCAEHSSLSDNTQFTRQINEAKSKIGIFTQRAQRNAEINRRKKLEFEARDDVKIMEREQERAKETGIAADQLLNKILRRTFSSILFSRDGENKREARDHFMEDFSERFVLSCLIPRAVGGTTIDSLTVAAFVERLFEGRTDNGNNNSNNNNNKNNNKQKQLQQRQQVKIEQEEEDDEDRFFQTLSLSLASYFIRAFCSMMATFSPAESKRGCVTLAKLFWFFIERVSDETAIELSCFITQSIFGVLFSNSTEGGSIPEFIQRTALNILENLRNNSNNNSNNNYIITSTLPTATSTSSSSSSTTTTAPKTASWVFPLTKMECRVLHPAVALHAKASSPLFASATKLYHYLKGRSQQLIASYLVASCTSFPVSNEDNSNGISQQQQQQQQMRQQQFSRELGKGEDDQALFAKARIGLDSVCCAEAASVQAVLSQHQHGGSATSFSSSSHSANARKQELVHRLQSSANDSRDEVRLLDEAYEASVSILLSDELKQIHRAIVKETGGGGGGGAAGEDGGEDDDESVDDEDGQGQRAGDVTEDVDAVAVHSVAAVDQKTRRRGDEKDDNNNNNSDEENDDEESDYSESSSGSRSGSESSFSSSSSSSDGDNDGQPRPHEDAASS